MATWATPPVFTVGAILTAAQQNTLSGDLTVLGPGGWYRKTTPNAVNTTVSATDLLNGEITIAAGVMGTTGCARLTAWGDWLQQSGGSVAPPRFQLLLGGTTLLDTGTSSTTVTSGATRAGWRLTAEILNAGSASSQVAALTLDLTSIIGFATAGAAGITVGEGVYGTTGTFAARAEGSNSGLAVNTASSAALVLNVINGSASASYETKLFGALVEVT